MTVESFRWLATPGCGVAAFLLVYDTHRALRPRIAGEQPWRESRVLGIATLVLGTLVLQRLDGPGWMNGAIGAVLALALVSAALELGHAAPARDGLPQAASRRLIPLTATEPP